MDFIRAMPVNGPSPHGGLRLGDDHLVVHHHTRGSDREPPLVEVKINSAKTGDFTSSEPCSRKQEPHRVQPDLPHVLKEGTEL